ncbi:Solute carrier family 22 member 15-like protein [Hordeum vulgare]|nr:Solute carrier family 22 member 15-like protein [Hordeum vulgare]
MSTTTEALLACSGSGGGECLSIDDALVLHAGEFGPWQLWHFLLVTAAWTWAGRGGRRLGVLQPAGRGAARRGGRRLGRGAARRTAAEAGR